MRTVGWRTVVLVLAPFAACALVYLPTLSGAFLSDDYAVLAAVSDWSREGHLLRALLSKFHSGLDSPSFLLPTAFDGELWRQFRAVRSLSFGVAPDQSGLASG